MILTVGDLARAPNALAAAYSRFGVDRRLLLTGHSHQAWPDVARDGHLAAWDDAALAVDDKWERAFAQAGRVRHGYRQLLGDPHAEIALGTSTHELLVRLLSAFDWRRRRRIVTTDGEFHTLRRQLARLEEEGIEIRREPARDVETLARRLAAAVDERALAVFVSAVLFETAEIVPGLDELAATCDRHGVPLVVDAYHALGVLPFRLEALGLESAYVVGGGYKYLQLGEGNAFLRLPPGAAPRPAITGWYAEFDELATRGAAGAVGYAPGAAGLAGATYDPTSHYRAARVFEFFVERGLTDAFLREVSQHQIGLLGRRFDALDLPASLVTRDRSRAVDRMAGFLALDSPRAGELRRALHARGVLCDHRGRRLRLGPAPYLCDAQLETAVEILADVARAL